MSWYVYILRCADDSLYTGITNDPRERLATHNRGMGAAYTRSRLPARLVYVEPVGDRSAALRRELAIKALPRRRKLELLAEREGPAGEAPLVSVPGFGAPHGFATRAGGVSEGPWRGLNLGANTDDDPDSVARNREIFRGWFGPDAELALLEQVHGDTVVDARPGTPQTADAQVSDDPALLLAIATADCLPLLFFDPASGAVGAAHCGWRGTLAGLAARTVEAMAERWGTRPRDLRVAIGPGICRKCYEVGDDLVERFTAAGFPAAVAVREEGRARLDLERANRHVLLEAGVPEGQILGTGSCTSCEPELYYSHRRDRGRTGRHWAAVRARSVAAGEE